MPTEVENLRELARSFWSNQEVICPKHGSKMKVAFVQTTYFDHIAIDCTTGREAITIPQRPRQVEFQPQSIEGLVENLQRGDNILCYRCQARLELNKREDPVTGRGSYTFTCVRCLSYGTWEGKPEEAVVGSAPGSGTRKK